MKQVIITLINEDDVDIAIEEITSTLDYEDIKYVTIEVK